MTHDDRWGRWPEIERVFDQAIEQPAGRRSSFLDAVCAGDVELRTLVDRLIAAAEAHSSIIDSPLSEQVAPLAAALQRRPRPTPGSRFGAYELIRELGQGGMATVYLARDLKHDREVAIKVLHAELAAVVGADRFVQEIRLTARLGHPHIVTLIESGETDGFLWYTIPSIRGASLRDRLERTKRLGIDDALTIARQIGAALDYAHRQGVIHRDIKPENILLHEGEAMLADFGIALAVQEAGGSRLAATGVPLGTPQYMSPEQAKGNAVDERSDVFSFAAVVYEMLAGTAPHAAETSREVMEKLLKEPPPLLRSVRKEIPAQVEAAVARALAKEPQERFASAGDFVHSLEVPLQFSSRRRTVVGVSVAVSLALAAGILPAVRRPTSPTAVVRDRIQLTHTGAAVTPAISSDGAEVAYVVRQCADGSCSYAIERELVNGGGRRRISAGWSAVFRISWSPDRQYLIVDGTLDRRYGAHLVSTSGRNAPRLLIGGPGTGATFVPGTDSILITNPVGADGIAWLRTISIGGGTGDSIPVARPGNGLFAAQMLPGRRWVIAPVNIAGTHVRILDRGGQQQDVVSFPPGVVTWLSARASRDALWLLLAGSPALDRRLVRLGVDTRSGKFQGRPDTVLLVKEATFDVTEDGKAIVHGQGTDRYDVWGLEIEEALRGEFTPARHLTSSTSLVDARISPDGEHVLVAGPGRAASLITFEGSRPTLLDSSSTIEHFGWMPDTTLLWYADRTASGFAMMVADPSDSTQQHVATIRARGMQACVPIVGGGWVWLPPTGGGVIQAMLPGDSRPRELRRPSEMRSILRLASATDGPRLLMTGWNAAGDSVLLYQIEFPGGEISRLAAFFAESENAASLADGSILVPVQETIGMATVYRINGRGLVEHVGVIPRHIGARGRITVSRNGRRLGITTQEYHGDIWLAKVSLTR